MTTKKMFSKFFQYFFMLNGLPVYNPNQQKWTFFFWYIWRISLVLRYNSDLLFYLHGMYTNRWKFPYSLFGIMDVTTSAFVVNSLIGKHRRLIELQKMITDNLIRHKFRILPRDRLKMKVLHVLFGILFAILISFLFYTLHKYSTKIKSTMDPQKESVSFKFFQIAFISITCWITTISYALYYCVFCKHLKAMYNTINNRVERLRELTAITQTPDDDSEFSVDSRCHETITSHNCNMMKDSKIIKASTTCWTTDSLTNEFTLSLPQVNTAKMLQNLKISDDIEKDRRFSCSVLVSSNLPNYPVDVPCVLRNCCSSEQDVRQSKYLARKIQKLNQKFASASLLVQETDNLFSLQVLTILTINFLRSCCYIYAYLSSDWSRHDCCAILSILAQIFFDFLAFGTIAIEASLVKEEAQKFAPLIISVDEVYRSKSMKVQVQTDVAQLTVYAFDVQLTAWKFYTVSRSFIPTVIGVTATYVLVIFQLHQIMQERQCDSLTNVTGMYLSNET